MTKNTKIAAIASAAALLAIGASMTSFAATGWQEEDGTWVYYDRYQDRVTDTWEKSGNNWYYLNGDGEMATDELIEYSDNYYYVDANGAMVTNQWVEMDNSDDDDEDAASTVWYYFQNNGKAYKAPTSGKTSFKTINGKKYAFDEDGKMLWGWVNETATRETGDDAWKNATYYCGSSDDGAQMYNSWGYIHVIDDREDDEDQDYWFYFGSNGKMYTRPDDKEGYYEKTINGAKYTFDEYGKMLSEFVASGTNSKPDDDDSVDVADGGVKYFRTKEEGARYTKGWFRVVPDKMFDSKDSEDNDDEARWFYADGKGKLYNNAIKTINGKKYAFDVDGEMLWGLRYLEFTNGEMTYYSPDELDSTDDVEEYTYSDTTIAEQAIDEGEEKDGLYAFGDEVTDGAMKTGSQTLTIDGESYSFLFKSNGTAKGVGQKGKKDNAFYVNGRKVKADSDSKYEVYTADEYGNIKTKLTFAEVKTLLESQTEKDNTDKYYGNKGKTQDPFFDAAYNTEGYENEYAYVVISSSGQYAKSGTKKDGNDYKFVLKNGQLYGIYYEK